MKYTVQDMVIAFVCGGLFVFGAMLALGAIFDG